MQCPDCSGAMWDNTANKRNPNSPDFKCKNKACGKGIWNTPREDRAPSNGNGNGNGHAPAPMAANGRAPLGPLYNECLDFAGKACAHYFPGQFTPSDVIAAAATLFIQAVRDGTPIRGAKPAPPPPPPPPPPVQHEYENLKELPF